MKARIQQPTPPALLPTAGSLSSDADFIAQAKKWCEALGTLSDGEIVCKLADLLAERYAAKRDLNQCKEWITAARERLQEMPADEETVELINTCPWWDSPENV